jgi:hypothetical protein
MRAVRVALLCLWLAAALACGCRQLAGVKDFQPPPDAGGKEVAPGDAPPGDVVGPIEAGIPGCVCDGCVQLAGGLFAPLSLALVGSDVYFLNYGPQGGRGSLMRVSTTGGGKATTVASGLTRPFSLTIFSGDAYWEEEDGMGHGLIVKLPLSGGAAQTLASGLPTFQDVESSGYVNAMTSQQIAVTSTNVYFAGYQVGSPGFPSAVNVLSVPVTGGAVSTFLSQWPADGGSPDAASPSDIAPLAIATDGTSLYLATQGFRVGLLEVPLLGGPPSVLVDYLTNPMALALSGSDVVFCDDSADFTTGTLEAISKSGGMASTLLINVTALAIVAAGNVVYFSEGNLNTSSTSTLEGFDLGTSKRKRFASGLLQIAALAVDSTNVYWVDSVCGTVMKVPR